MAIRKKASITTLIYVSHYLTQTECFAFFFFLNGQWLVTWDTRISLLYLFVHVKNFTRRERISVVSTAPFLCQTHEPCSTGWPKTLIPLKYLNKCYCMKLSGFFFSPLQLTEAAKIEQWHHDNFSQVVRYVTP